MAIQQKRKEKKSLNIQTTFSPCSCVEACQSLKEVNKSYFSTHLGQNYVLSYAKCINLYFGSMNLEINPSINWAVLSVGTDPTNLTK